MPSLSELLPGVCDELLKSATETDQALARLAQTPLGMAAGDDLGLARAANAEALSLLNMVCELQKTGSHPPAAAEPGHLHKFMDEVDRRWRGRAEEAGVTLMVAYDGDPECTVMVDFGRLLQVVDALVAGAVAQGGGVVEASLSTRPLGEKVAARCEVRDSGPGGESAEGASGPASSPVARLRELFVAEIVTAMGGGLELTPNVGPGRTIAFELELPRPKPTPAATAPHALAGRGAHVLVVDDNATNRMVVEALCQMFDCSSESVVDGVEAVEAARVGRFDVILMDIRMPRMDGVTAAREIRRQGGPAGCAPIIALTANAAPDDVRSYLAAGMCAVVEKPIKAERLLAAMEAALAGNHDQGAAAAVA